MSNAIEQLALRMRYGWEEAVSTPQVKLIRLLYRQEDELMLGAFYDYLLDVDSDSDELVFILQVGCEHPDSFSEELLQALHTEVEDWNSSSRPAEFEPYSLAWEIKPQYTDRDNPAALAIRNLASFTEYILEDVSEGKCNFIVDLQGSADKNVLSKWLDYALRLPWPERMTFTIADEVGRQNLKDLALRFDDVVVDYCPSIDLDGAMEKIAEQALQESNAEDPREDEFRLALVQLVNSVKRREGDATQRLAKQCLDIALHKVETDATWMGQFVTIYAILMNDQLAYEQTEDALYFADKAIEAAQLSIGILEDSQAYRLLGNTLLSKASILVGLHQWRSARDLYRQGADSYAYCKDYFMQMDALRMCGLCSEKISEDKDAAEYYVQGFKLRQQLSTDVVKNSTFPFIALALEHNRHRNQFVSDIDFIQSLEAIYGADWSNELYQFKKLMAQHPPQTPQIDGKPSTAN